MDKTYITKFLKSGRVAEQEFAKLFRETEFSTKEQDIHEHWDVAIKYKIDIKGLKKINRNDADVNENIHWIEIKGVTGYLGWLYADEVDFFAFELKKYWIIVEKMALQEFIANNVIKEYIQKPTLYKLYRRQGRQDTITLVESFDLIYIAECLIKK